MTFTTHVDLEHCGPTQLFLALPSDVRLAAAKALYAHDWGESPTRREADVAIMQGMRFRETAVRQLPIDKRAGYLARSIRPSESLASSLLLALHLEHRRPILSAFMDALGIPHQDGLIAEGHETKPPSKTALTKAIKAIKADFPEADVDVYLASLYVLDRETWANLGSQLAVES
jgi:hypothetical protein